MIYIIANDALVMQKIVAIWIGEASVRESNLRVAHNPNKNQGKNLSISTSLFPWSTLGLDHKQKMNQNIS